MKIGAGCSSQPCGAAVSQPPERPASSWGGLTRLRVSRSHGYLCALLLAGGGSGVADDWPRFRGPDGQGVSAEPILTPWPAEGLPVVWTTTFPGCRGGGTFAAAQGRVFVLLSGSSSQDDTLGPGEWCVALDEGSGACLWGVKLGDYSFGSYSTPTVVGGRVYAYSGRRLHCLDAVSGAVQWEHDLPQEYGARNGGVHSQSPWVENGRVFVSIDAATECLMAFDAMTGDLLWRSNTGFLTYASPVGATIHGVRQIIFPDRCGLVSVAPDSGQPLWRYRQTCTTCQGPSPVVQGEIVLATKNSGYHTGDTDAVRIDYADGVFSTHVLWTKQGFGDLYTTLVVDGDSVYGTSGGRLYCLDLATGEERWRSPDGVGFKSVILADHFLLGQNSRTLVLAEASPLGYHELARSQLPQYYWADNSPSFGNGRIYMRRDGVLSCLAVSPPSVRVGATLLPGTDEVRLTIACSDGSLLTTNRAGRITVRWSSDPAQPFAEWTLLTTPWAFTNGVLSAELPVVRTGPPRFYIATE